MTTRNILPLAARAADGTAEMTGAAGFDSARIQLEVTAVSGLTPTLDVFVEDSVDAGATWNPVTTFTRRTDAGREVVSLTRPFADRLRLRWVLGGTTPSFTFAADWSFV